MKKSIATLTTALFLAAVSAGQQAPTPDTTTNPSTQHASKHHPRHHRGKRHARHHHAAHQPTS